MSNPLVGIVMGSDSDWPVMQAAADALAVGEVSEPVQSQFGWHVIRLEERRDRPVPSLAEVREELATFLTRKAQQDAVVALRGTAKIERLDQPAAPPVPTEVGRPGVPATPAPAPK